MSNKRTLSYDVMEHSLEIWINEKLQRAMPMCLSIIQEKAIGSFRDLIEKEGTKSRKFVLRNLSFNLQTNSTYEQHLGMKPVHKMRTYSVHIYILKSLRSAGTQLEKGFGGPNSLVTK